MKRYSTVIRDLVIKELILDDVSYLLELVNLISVSYKKPENIVLDDYFKLREQLGYD